MEYSKDITCSFKTILQFLKQKWHFSNMQILIAMASDESDSNKIPLVFD